MYNNYNSRYSWQTSLQEMNFSLNKHHTINSRDRYTENFCPSLKLLFTRGIFKFRIVLLRRLIVSTRMRQKGREIPATVQASLSKNTILHRLCTPEGNVICISTWKSIKKLRGRNNIVFTISELAERAKNNLYTVHSKRMRIYLLLSIIFSQLIFSRINALKTTSNYYATIYVVM